MAGEKLLNLPYLQKKYANLVEGQGSILQSERKMDQWHNEMPGQEKAETRRKKRRLRGGSEPDKAHNLDRTGSTPVPASNFVCKVCEGEFSTKAEAKKHMYSGAHWMPSVKFGDNFRRPRKKRRTRVGATPMLPSEPVLSIRARGEFGPDEHPKQLTDTEIEELTHVTHKRRPRNKRRRKKRDRKENPLPQKRRKATESGGSNGVVDVEGGEIDTKWGLQEGEEVVPREKSNEVV